MLAGHIHRSLAVALVALTLAATSAPAHAGARLRVAVEPFDGPRAQAAQAQRTVERVLAEHHVVVEGRDAGDADAIIAGTVRRRGKRYTLALQVRAAATGKLVDTLRVPLRGKRLRARAIADDLHDALAWIEPAPAPAPAPTPAPAPAPAPTPDAGDHALRAVAERAPPAVVDAAPRGRVYAGMSVLARRLTFVHQASLAPAQRPTDYDGGMVGGLHAQGAIYPARLIPALAGQRALQRLGVAFELDRALGLRSRFDDGVSAYDLPTTQTRWGLGLRYRVLVGATELTAAAGLNRLDHHIERGDAQLGLPDVSYRYVDVGAGARVPLGRRLAATAELRYLIVTDAGDLVAAEHYGRASVGGYDVDAGLELAVTDRLGVRVGARAVRLAFDFDGTGELSTGLDGDPDQDVGGAADRYLGGYALAGYAF